MITARPVNPGQPHLDGDSCMACYEASCSGKYPEGMTKERRPEPLLKVVLQGRQYAVALRFCRKCAEELQAVLWREICKDWSGWPIVRDKT